MMCRERSRSYWRDDGFDVPPPFPTHLQIRAGVSDKLVGHTEKTISMGGEHNNMSEGLAEKIARLIEEQRRRRPPKSLERTVLERLKQLERETLEQARVKREHSDETFTNGGELEELVDLLRGYERANFAPLGWFEPTLDGDGLDLRLEAAASSMCHLHSKPFKQTSSGFLIQDGASAPDDAEHRFSLGLEYDGLPKCGSRLRISWELSRSFELGEEHLVGFDFVGLLDVDKPALHESRLYPDAALASANPDGFDPLHPSQGEFSLTRAELGFPPHRLMLARLFVMRGESLG